MSKKTLLLTAGLVWLAAGFNVARIGVLEYASYASVLFPLLSLLVFLLFGLMFWKMSQKHIARILSYEEERLCILRFFDAKSYVLMACMMTFGVWLRYSGLVPLWFIAFFYTGLGSALALAGILFLVKRIRLEFHEEAALEEAEH